MEDDKTRRQKVKDWTASLKLKEPYLLLGIAHPERALLNIPEFAIRASHKKTKDPLVVIGSILNGRISIHIYSDAAWSVIDLKNIALGIIEREASIISLLLDYAFSIEITQIINLNLGINQVFSAPGAGTPFTGDGMSAYLHIKEMTKGEPGVYLSRSLSDLSMALSRTSDASFYCYRSIESLMHHCSIILGLEKESKQTRWQAFRDRASCSINNLMTIKSEADPLRHGKPLENNILTNTQVIQMTRTIIKSYLDI